MSKPLRTLLAVSRNIAGPSRLPIQIRKASTEGMSTSLSEYPEAEADPARPATTISSIPPASLAVYPYSSKAIASPPTTTLPPRDNLLHPKQGWSIIEHQNAHLRTLYDTQNLGSTIFARRTKERLRTGSIITVVSYTGPEKTNTTSFSGVLIATRHRGVDTTFRIRNVVSRVGVERAYKVCSPLIKEVIVVRRAKGKKGERRDLRHRKAYWIRDTPNILTKVAASIRVK